MTDLVRALVSATGLSMRDVYRIISNAPVRYKHYTIAKRTGGRRHIAHPARELKVLQRAFVELYLKNLPVDPAATAYRKGYSIRDNALPHAQNGPILKMDFLEFFNSIRSTDWDLYCDDRGLFTDPVERLQSVQLLFHRAPGLRGLRLAIGAPSSPHLSNLLMYDFDALISAAVTRDFVTYTRYADDLTFSAKRTGYLTGVERRVLLCLREIRWPNLSLNDKKTIVATKKYHRQVTGLVLTNDGDVSVGRDRKRLLRAAVHRALSTPQSEEWLNALRGQIAFVQGVEPDFVRRLERHYGVETMDALRRPNKEG
jgi:RNA-directed DNA polymerase